MSQPEKEVKTSSLGLNQFIRLHGKKAALIVFIVGVFFFLDTGVSYSFTTDKVTYAVGEIITATVQVTNPYPFPIRYWGYSSNIIPEEGVPLKEIAGYAAQAAADKANWYSGKSGKGIWLDSLESRVISLHHYTASEEGSYRMEGLVRHRTMYWQSSVDYTNTEYKPVWVSANSTGITLVLEASEDADNPVILIRVRNDNLYPVRIPVFPNIMIKHGSIENELETVVHIYWDIIFWDIPAYSIKTIYNTETYASDTRTPIYYTLYGQTLRYPPE